jgi:AraC family transcriptional regulator
MHTPHAHAGAALSSDAGAVPPHERGAWEDEGTRKYPASSLLLTSAGRDWSTIVAELRRHGAGSIASPVQNSMEIVIALPGGAEGLVIRAGDGKLQETRLAAGKVWLAPVDVAPEEITITAAGMTTLHLFLAPGQFDVLADQYNLPRSRARAIQYAAGVSDDLIRRTGLSVLAELRRETATSRMFVETASTLLAARLIHGYGEEQSAKTRAERPCQLDRVRLQRVLEYVELHLEEEITVAGLAEIAHLSPFHFTRMFTAAVGAPPYRYVSRRRLEGAMTALAAGRLPLSEIAYRAGFSSQASFNRAFRRVTGATPGEFRRRAR